MHTAVNTFAVHGSHRALHANGGPDAEGHGGHRHLLRTIVQNVPAAERADALRALTRHRD